MKNNNASQYLGREEHGLFAVPWTDTSLCEQAASLATYNKRLTRQAVTVQHVRVLHANCTPAGLRFDARTSIVLIAFHHFFSLLIIVLLSRVTIVFIGECFQ